MSRRHAGRFSKCPTWWVREGLLREFKGGRTTGTSIAGLKCLIAISHHVYFYTLKAELSFSHLESLTGLSRPMVSKGISLLEELEIIRVEKKYRSIYELVEKVGNPGWGQLPIAYLKKELPSIPNRGRVTLFALKLYFQLIADRPNDSPSLPMKHDTISSKVGTQARDIKPSIDILVNHLLVAVHRSEDVDKDGFKHAKNVYTLRGL